MVFIVGSQNTIGQISNNSLLFLVLSGVATGASWICYFKALSMGDVNKALGLPDSLMAEFGETTGADGKQTEDFPEQGVTVSWKYHPDKGLEVTYKILKSSK